MLLTLGQLQDQALANQPCPSSASIQLVLAAFL